MAARLLQQHKGTRKSLRLRAPKPYFGFCEIDRPTLPLDQRVCVSKQIGRLVTFRRTLQSFARYAMQFRIVRREQMRRQFAAEMGGRVLCRLAIPMHRFTTLALLMREAGKMCRAAKTAAHGRATIPANRGIEIEAAGPSEFARPIMFIAFAFPCRAERTNSVSAVTTSPG